MSKDRNDAARTARNCEALQGTRPAIDDRLVRDILDANEQRPDAADAQTVVVKRRVARATHSENTKRTTKWD